MNILAVSHDAGGAEVVAAYVKKNARRANFFCIADGPATAIFKRNGLAGYFCDFFGSPAKFFAPAREIDMVLSSLSWSSTLEQDFLRAAKRRGIKTAVYLDHWVNYRERFGYPRKNWRNNLPDEIWVGDRYAFKLAVGLFGRSLVRFVPNIVFENVRKEYKGLVRSLQKGGSGSILFLSEPVSAAVNTFGDKNQDRVTEFKILEELLSYFARHNEARTIVIRFHPSGGRDKYDKILFKYKKNLSIVKSKNADLLADIAGADLIIGIESMALVTAVLCGKAPVVSFMPDKNYKCSLPFKQIIKIKNVDDLAKISVL